jgi:hypothetical protein
MRLALWLIAPLVACSAQPSAPDSGTGGGASNGGGTSSNGGGATSTGGGSGGGSVSSCDVWDAGTARACPAVTGAWELTSSGLPGSAIISLLVDPSDAGLVYAGTSGAGVYRSLNGGATWSATSGAGTGSLYSLASGAGSVLYAGDFGRAWTSGDRGATWAPFAASLPLTNGPVFVATDPAAGSSMAIGGHRGLWVSADAGAGWTALITAPVQPNIAGIAFSPLHHEAYVVERLALDVIADGGDAFSTSRQPPNTQPVSVTVGSDGTVIVGTTSTTAPGFLPPYAVARSSDGASTWTQSSAGLCSSQMMWRLQAAASPSVVFGIAGIVDAPPLNGEVRGRIFRSGDGAQSWVDVTGDLPPQLSALALAPGSDEDVFVGTIDGCVYRTHSGGR